MYFIYCNAVPIYYLDIESLSTKAENFPWGRLSAIITIGAFPLLHSFMFYNFTPERYLTLTCKDKSLPRGRWHAQRDGGGALGVERFQA